MTDPKVFINKNASYEDVIVTTDEEQDHYHKKNDNGSNEVLSDTLASSFVSQFRVPDYSSSEMHPRNIKALPLPAFNKRPLSDTPFVSNHTSPVLSSDNNTPMGNISDNELALSPITASSKPHHTPLQKNASALFEEADNDADNDDSDEEDPILASKKFLDSKKPFTVVPQSRIERQTQRPKRRATTLDVPGLTKSRDSPDGTIASLDVASKLVIVMVGLPARGKSYITNKLARYLNWMHHDCKVFNVGNTRRKTDSHNLGPSSKPLTDIENTSHSANFFSPDNKSSLDIREKWAMDTLDELLKYVLYGPGAVGIFDATNSTYARRERIVQRINESSENRLKILFLESYCDEQALIQSNIRLKLSGPDYKQMDKDKALIDFTERLSNYEKVYQTLDETKEKKIFKKKHIGYVKMINVGEKFITFKISGFLACQTIEFLLNFNLKDRLIILTRHGESFDNVEGRIGGDCGLTARGVKFAKALTNFVTQKRDEFNRIQLQEAAQNIVQAHDKEEGDASDDDETSEQTFGVWTSMLKRSIDTAKYFNSDEFFVKEMRMLNELGSGKMEGLTYKEIQERYPQEFEARIENKLTYRYPGLGGESYLDVVNRLKPIITEIERAEDHLLLITHRVVSRILLGYFLNISKEHIGDLDIPLHSVYILEPKPYGVDWSLYEYDEHKDSFFKVDKFKYTKRLKENDLSNSGRQRKYSVVPSVPSGALGRFRESRSGSNNLHRLRNLNENYESTGGLNFLEAVASVHSKRPSHSTSHNDDRNPFELSHLKQRLNEVQRSQNNGNE
ncbi:6-phosphofructo-2-kinase [Saccharomycopsis crataegensis]|uniref:6-phosphofructo-2-kinase n=1 Tax=Saccharomycopsis crataegensis TaxID=43959 RepID=A0AAV5QN20_9ASCO|nr:6-phosphofructo-2-kinase [Saccharomycopsis crataegensis]